MNSTLKKINGKDIAKIASGQVIVDLKSVVKELIENALDANATNIDIKLTNYGADLIEVSDNGSGILPADFSNIALKYYTSKISTFDDIHNISSFGFRGEALSCICELSGEFVVITRHKSCDIGNHIKYNADGSIAQQREQARTVGTTILINNLFEKLPVRRKAYLRSSKTQLSNMITLVQSYAISCVGIRISLSHHIPSTGKTITILSVPANYSLKQRVQTIFGSHIMNTLCEFGSSFHVPSLYSQETTLSDSTINSSLTSQEPIPVKINDNEIDRLEYDFSSKCEWNHVLSSVKDDEIIGYVTGYVSRIGSSMNSSDRGNTNLSMKGNVTKQLVFVNGRLIEYKKMIDAFIQVWREYEPRTMPAMIINVILPPNYYDINLSTDKKQILLMKEDVLLTAFQEIFRYAVDSSNAHLKVVSVNMKDKDRELKKNVYKENRKLVDTVKPKNNQNVAISEEKIVKDRTSVSKPKLNINRLDDERKDNDVVPVFMQNDVVVSSSLEKDMAVSSLLQKDMAVSPSLQNEMVVSSLLQNKMAVSSSLQNKMAVSSSLQDNSTISSSLQDNSTISSSLQDNSTISSSLQKEIDLLFQPTQQQQQHTSHSLHTPSSQKRSHIESTSRITDSIPVVVDRCKKSKKRHDPIHYTPAKSTIQHQVEIIKTPNKTESSSPDVSTLSSHPVLTRTASNDLSQTATIPISVMYSQFQSLIHDSPSFLSNPFSSLYLQSNRILHSDFADNDSASQQTAEQELTRVLQKSSFLEMTVLGQFNNTFIICQLGNDLYILDQHACDEKFNYENLMNNLVMQNQRLIQPILLELSPDQEFTVIHNVDLFHNSGFEVHIDENKELGSRIQLIALPSSKQYTFSVEDFMELLTVIMESSGTVKRTPKLAKLLATRACHKSVRAGDPLTYSKMIVRGLATLDRPWSCPHGYTLNASIYQ